MLLQPTAAASPKNYSSDLPVFRERHVWAVQVLWNTYNGPVTFITFSVWLETTTIYSVLLMNT